MSRAVLLAASAVAFAPVLLLADVAATVNGTASTKPISPLIFGSNQSTIPSTNDRLGGNRWTAYNWETNASNAGRDFQYQNDGFLSASNTPGAAMLPTLQAAAAAGRATTLTVPIVGYVSADKNGNGDVRYVNGTYNPNYLSARFNVSQPVKGSAFTTSPNLSDGRVYQDEFVNWVNANKTAAQQVLYSLDNEPDLWFDTHPEVRPGAFGGTQAKATYAEIIQRNTDYAAAVKSVSPNAKVLGAVNYGWDGYRSLQQAPDAAGRDFQATYLAGMKTASDAAGKRLIDALDFHYYPEAQGGTTGGGTRVTGNQTDAATVAARIQAPRSLWDTTYVENSYITRDILPAGDKPIRLLPRTQSLINANYAGTLMSVSEYNFGGGDHISGGLAQADVLGVFAEQGVFSANWWDLGNGSAFTNAAQRMYLNYDGAGGKFGDTSLGSTVSDNGAASVHASIDSATGKLVLVVINKSGSAQNLALALQNLGNYTVGQAYGFNGTTAIAGGVAPIASLGGVSVTNGTLSYAMSPLSVTTIVLPQATSVLYFTGSQSANLLTASGGLTNFSTSADGATPSAAVPNKATDVVFAASSNVNTANFTSTLNAAWSVNSLTFGAGANASTPVAINGSGTITIYGFAGTYTAGTGITVAAGAAATTIGTNVSLLGSQRWTNNAASAFTVSGGVSIDGYTLTLAGPGNQSLTGAITGAGGVTSTASGVVRLAGANTYTGRTKIDNAAGTLRLAPAATTVTLGGGGGGLDVARGQVVFEYSGTSPVATLRGLLAAAFTAPNTPGVIDSGMVFSSTATATRGLGYRDDGTTVTVKPALFGDVNLDGSVLIGDFNAFATGFGQAGGKIWTDGDFNYDGSVGIGDFNLLAVNFGQSLPPAADWAPLLAFAAAHDDLAGFAALTGVPEPAALGGIGTAGVLFGLRRRA